MNVLVIGGTGVISSRIVDELVERNDRVSIVNRGKTGSSPRSDVILRIADRKDLLVFKTACTTETYDVVIDMICFDIHDAKQTIELFRNRTKQIIICSTVSVYKRPYVTLPVQEDSEKLMDDPIFPYSYHKARMEEFLFEAYRQHGVPITIVRPSLTFGAGTRNLGTFRQNFTIIERIKAGKPLVVCGDGHHPWTYSFAPDVATAIISLMGQDQAIGEAYHVTSEEHRVWEDLYREFGRLLGVEPHLVHVPSKMLCDSNPELCAHLYFEKSYAGIFSNDKRHALVEKRIPCRYTLSSGVRLVYESWLKDGLKADPLKDRYEDAWVECIAACEASVRDIRM